MRNPHMKFGYYHIDRPVQCRPDHFCETCLDTGTVAMDADPDNEVRCPDCKGDPEGYWISLVEGAMENEAYDRWKDER